MPADRTDYLRDVVESLIARPNLACAFWLASQQAPPTADTTAPPKADLVAFLSSLLTKADLLTAGDLQETIRSLIAAPHVAYASWGSLTGVSSLPALDEVVAFLTGLLAQADADAARSEELRAFAARAAARAG